jgi:hypothetical protein
VIDEEHPEPGVKRRQYATDAEAEALMEADPLKQMAVDHIIEATNLLWASFDAVGYPFNFFIAKDGVRFELRVGPHVPG